MAEAAGFKGEFWLCPGFLAAYAAVVSHMSVWHPAPAGTGMSSMHDLVRELAPGIIGQPLRAEAIGHG